MHRAMATSETSGAGRLSVGLLVVRVLAGWAMVLHGLPKMSNPLHWMDRAPNPAPSLLQGAAAASEFFGGVGLALGLATPLCALGIGCTMAVAAYTHLAKGDPFVAKGGPSYEPALQYLALMVLISLAGPGDLSLDAVIARWWRARTVKQ